MTCWAAAFAFALGRAFAFSTRWPKSLEGKSNTCQQRSKLGRAATVEATKEGHNLFQPGSLLLCPFPSLSILPWPRMGGFTDSHPAVASEVANAPANRPRDRTLI